MVGGIIRPGVPLRSPTGNQGRNGTLDNAIIVHCKRTYPICVAPMTTPSRWNDNYRGTAVPNDKGKQPLALQRQQQQRNINNKKTATIQQQQYGNNKKQGKHPVPAAAASTKLPQNKSPPAPSPMPSPMSSPTIFVVVISAAAYTNYHPILLHKKNNNLTTKKMIIMT